MREVWRPVVDFETRYSVSNLGNVKRLEVPQRKGTGRYYRPEMKLKQRFNNKGYAMVDLWDVQERYQLLVHRLVAMAFIPNPNNYKCINHKDENPLNNNINNLEWCTQKYNMNYGNVRQKISIANGNPIYQIDKTTGKIIKRFNSAMDAQRELGISNGSINDLLQGRKNRKTVGGYKWIRCIDL